MIREATGPGVCTHWHAAAATQNRPTPERLAQLACDELPPAVRPLADDILKVSSAALGGPYNALLRSPHMAGAPC